jgi:L-ascorbate metabolism protein UlaG (beta-lactamase superfamily)
LPILLEKARRNGKLFLNPVPTTVVSPATMVKVFLAYLRNREERSPKHPIGPFHTDPRVYDTAPSTGLRITWLGHSTVLIEIDGKRIITDPLWEQRASPFEWAGPRRFFPPPLKLQDLPPIDVMLLSHDHYDHLGVQTIRQLASRDTQWVAPLGVGAILQKLGVEGRKIQELDWTEKFTLDGLTITALPARHFSGRSAFNRFHTLWASYVIVGPQPRIYHGADSGEWPGFREIGQEYGPFDLTTLEIGAFDPMWADIHMGPDGAARSFRALGGTGLLMPIHWGLFDLALHAWRQPIERLFSIHPMSLWTPVPGMPTEVEPSIPLRSYWWR